MHTYYNIYKVVILKDTKDVILELRMKKACHKINLPKRSIYKASGIPLGNKETIPNTETLKLLSKFFDVSINTLLGSPRQLICRCCGMPLDDSSISKEPDGKFNEEYCKWCYAEGKFTYNKMDDLINFCAEHMANENWTSEQVREYMSSMLPKLNYWKCSDQ